MLPRKGGQYQSHCAKSDGKIMKATLEIALFIPTNPQCIFSVQAATRLGAKVKFNGEVPC